MSKILIVDDDTAFAGMLQKFLEKKGHTIELRGDVKSALKTIGSSQTFHLILLDFRLPDGDGLSILEKINSMPERVPAIMMTSFNDVRTAVRAIRTGALNYITKPINPDELLMVVDEALKKKREERVVETVVAEKPKEGLVEGKSEAAKQLKEHIELVAPTMMSVLITGESGTGKENVARTIHALSERSKGPFVAVDCGALSNELSASQLFGHVRGAFTGADQTRKGAFEVANGGTLFLDEVGNLSYDVQVKLLRGIQERQFQALGSNELHTVDVRVICATNEDLGESVRTKKFRDDLFHRLNEFNISVPPLRSRDGDLDIFLDFFVREANRELNRNVKSFSADVMRIFRQYDWPGNLRELKNVVRRGVLLTKGTEAGANVLPNEMTIEAVNSSRIMGDDLKSTQEAIEKEMILKALTETRYNKSKAAQKLNIDRKTLYQKLLKYNIES